MPEVPKPGEPGGLVGPLEEALVKAAKATPADTADPLVSAAFALGWQMAELYRPRQRRRVEKTDDDLPGLGSLGDDDRVGIMVDQVQASVTKLSAKIKECGLVPVDLGPLRESLSTGRPELSVAVETAHKALLRTLTATDFRFGKAYGLGRALADTCRKPSDAESLRTELGRHRIANLRGWFDDLSSAFPPHAAHSVAASLEVWVKWAEGAEMTAIDDRLRAAFRRQGELWRALLSGEKRPTEMLEIDNYLDAARGLADHMHVVLRGVVVRFPWIVLTATLLLFGGIALLIIGGGSAIVAGAGSILAALGLTWKGLGGALGQLAGKLEQPLWGAVLDDVIAKAITLTPENKADHGGRHAVAVEMSRGST